MANINDWLTIDKIYGSGNATLTASVKQNTTNSERTQVLKFKTQTKEVLVSIKQSGFVYETSVSPSSTFEEDWRGSFRKEATESLLRDYRKTITITTNATGTITGEYVTEEVDGYRWFSVSPKNTFNPSTGKAEKDYTILTFEIHMNPNNTTREGQYNVIETLNGVETVLVTLTIRQGGNPYENNIIYTDGNSVSGSTFTAPSSVARSNVGKNRAAIAYDKTLTEIEEDGLSGVTVNTTVEIPTTVKKVCANAFNFVSEINGSTGMANFTTLIGGENIEIVEERAFFGCIAMEKYPFDKKVHTLGAYAFDSNYALREWEFNPNLEEIPMYCFNATGIEEIDLTNTQVHTIGTGSFGTVPSGGVVKLPSTLTKLGSGSFDMLDGSILRCYMLIPPSISEQSFSINSRSRSWTIYYPCGSNYDEWETVLTQYYPSVTILADC